jgi:transposase-like protein
MAARSRDSVARSASSESQMTYTRFLELFPDNAACLDYLKDKFYADGTECPSCHKATKFHRIKSRSAYSCQYCRHQVYPTAGTIFHKSTTSLQLWFWAIYLMSSTRCGISAKQLEREIGVSYKTAHRMFKQIRSLLSDEGDGPLGGKVEADETAMGGKPRRGDVAKFQREGESDLSGAGGRWRQATKTTVFAMVEREGRVRATVVPDRRRQTLQGVVKKHVLPASTIFTDEWPAYHGDYKAHHRIRHSEEIYVEGNVHTQTIEGFFGLVKNGIRGVYHSVSTRYLQNYLDEYSFRYNRRKSDQPIFWAILDRVAKPSPAAA